MSVRDKECWDSGERRVAAQAVAGKVSWSKCGFYEDLEIRVGFKAGVLRRLEVGTISIGGYGPSERMTVTIPKMPLPNDTPTVLSQSSTTRAYLPPCFQWGKGGGGAGHLLQSSFPTSALLARLPPFICPTFTEHSLLPGALLGPETQSRKYMVFVL